MVLMHKPAWEYDSASFAQIEQLPDGQDDSVIAGHGHYYGYSKRRGRDYIKMATTGGIWLKDGAFDKRGAKVHGVSAPLE